MLKITTLGDGFHKARVYLGRTQGGRIFSAIEYVSSSPFPPNLFSVGRRFQYEGPDLKRAATSFNSIVDLFINGGYRVYEKESQSLYSKNWE